MSLRACCVYLPAVCSAITCVASYWLTLQVARRGSEGAGLYAAAFVAVVPSYLSRSCAGAYDNECVAIPALVATCALYLKALNTPGGSTLWATLSAIVYGYMVLAWGGHVFVVNLIAVHCLAMLLCGRFTGRLYVACSTFYVCAGLLAVQTPFVRGKIMGGSSEYIIALCAFALVQVRAVVPILHSTLRRSGVQPSRVLVAGGVLLVLLTALKVIHLRDWADGRLRRLLDPTRAATSLVASVVEHQTARWSTLFKDLHLLQVLFPVGLILLAQSDREEHRFGSDSDSNSDSAESVRSRSLERRRALSDDARMFVAMFGCFALYFNGIMERCSLIFAPVACVVSGIAASRAVSIYAAKILGVCSRWADQKGAGDEFRKSVMTGEKTIGSSYNQHEKSAQHHHPMCVELATWLGATGVVLALLVMTCLYIQHAVWMAAVEFSSPSVIFAKPHDISIHASGSVDDADRYIDDFREAFLWLRLNTPEDAKVISWWDYGYQIAALANRTTFVDNNTWNNTAIAAVGRVLVSSEAEGARLMRQMGADFVLIVFGGKVGWPHDDIGKMMWPVRIASEVFPEAIREADFLTGSQLRMDSFASRAVKESLLVKCAYHRFGQRQHDSVSGDSGSIDCDRHGYDRARMSYGPFGDASSVGTGSTHTKSHQALRELREVFSTTNWVVRIFAVNPEPNRS